MGTWSRLDLERIWNYIGFRNIPPVEFAWRKVRALWRDLFFSENNNQTFDEFVLEVFGRKIGDQWFKEQRKKDEQEKHFLYKCFVEYQKQRQSILFNEDTSTPVWYIPNGYSQYLISIAFDVFCLIQTSNLNNGRMLKRLKDSRKFQWAAYEIRVAGIFARAGAQIDFLDDVNRSIKHCEFIAKKWDIIVSVEAKSKHRKGVLNEEGEVDSDSIFDWNITKQIAEAKGQKWEGLFYVFIDLNSPIIERIDAWQAEVQKQLPRIVGEDGIHIRGLDGLRVTNFGFHYDAEEEHKSSKFVFMKSGSIWSTVDDFTSALIKGAENYGIVPNLDQHR